MSQFNVREFVSLQSTTNAPSKRSNKTMKSGRAGRRSYNGSRTLAAVMGTTDLMQAIYAPADKEMCKVVDHRTGYNSDGSIFRSPDLGCKR